MIRAFATIALTLLSVCAAEAAQGVPKLDVARSCREAGNFGGGADSKRAYDGCMQDENEALSQLQRNWTRYKPENRSTCLAQGTSPMPSYVEILTCIEMYDEAGALHKAPPAIQTPARPSPGAAPAPAPTGDLAPK